MPRHQRKRSENLVPRLTKNQIEKERAKVFAEMAESESHFQNAPIVPPRPVHTYNKTHHYIPVSELNSPAKTHSPKSRKSSMKTPRSSAKRKRSSNNNQKPTKRTPFQTPKFLGSPPMVFSPDTLSMFNTPSTKLAKDMKDLHVKNPLNESPEYGFKSARNDLLHPQYVEMGIENNNMEVPPVFHGPSINPNKKKTRKSSHRGGVRKSLMGETAKDKFKELVNKIQDILHGKSGESEKIKKLVELYTSEEYGYSENLAHELAKLKVNQNVTRKQYGYENNKNTRPLIPVILKRKTSKRHTKFDAINGSPIPPLRSVPSIELTNEDLLEESENNNNTNTSKASRKSNTKTNIKLSNKTRRHTLRRGTTFTNV